ncbi:MAG: hypothetical protein EYC68_00975 [Chloroflexota bacterium]|nr:MAG: hypothetical protein EYC68_00975 [Chloroflexota bacterium]
MPRLKLNVLGPLQIALANEPIAKLESDKTRALLVYLAVEAARAHRRAALLGLLWPDYPEETARHNLRQALFNLRRAIGDHTAEPPFFFITRDEIQFNPACDHSLDVEEFDAYLAACERHAHANIETCALCAAQMQQAIDLYRGKFLQEFFLEGSAEFEEWALARREATHQRALDALTHLANYYEQHGDLAATRRAALRQLELDPWREQAHRQMMRALVTEGQRNAALAQYETCRRVLAQELGVEPSVETRELYEKIKSGNSKFEIRNSIQPPTSNLQLPTPLTPFLGRERELSELAQLSADDACRLLTLVAPGGMGKTRLALQAAAQQRGRFAHGVAFVPLAAIHSPAAVIPALADALGFTFYGPTSPRVQLLNFLRDKQMLLVLDNVEQLVDAAELFVELLQHAPEIKLLLTSREPLNVQGEWVFEVAGLEVPADARAEQFEASSAAALFMQRARRTRAGFALDAPERASVVRLCRLVEGMPLALELAATWVKTLTVAEIVAEIERNLDFLGASLRDLPERHRSVRAVFDSSWQMLPSEEQRVLAKLSALHGDFQREAAEQIADASLSLLSALVTKSLVRRTLAGRYDLHELVRQYAVNRLSENAMQEAATRAQHSRYYLALAQKSESDLFGPRQVQAVAALNAEIENVRAAWQWAARHDTVALRAPTRALYWHYDLRNLPREGAALFELAIANAPAWTDTAAREIAVGHWRAFQAMFAYRENRIDAAEQHLAQSFALLEKHGCGTELIDALWIQGQVAWARGDFDLAARALRRALAVQAARSQWQTAICYIMLGNVEFEQGRDEDSYRTLTESLRVARAQGDPTMIAYAISSLTRHASQRARIAELEPLAREACELAKTSGNRFAVALALAQLAQLVWAKRDVAQAKQLCRESIAVCRAQGDDWWLSATLNQLGNFEMATGNLIEAEQNIREAIQVALRGGFHTNALDALVSMATARAKADDTATALEIVSVVLQDPATKHRARTRAEKLRGEIKARATLQEIKSVHAREKTFEQLTNEIVTRASR